MTNAAHAASSLGRGQRRSFGSVLLLCGILALNLVVTPNFLKVETLWAMLLQSFPLIIMSLGMALVMASGGLDLSVGASTAVSSVIFARLVIDAGWSVSTAAMPAVGAALAIGVANGLIVGFFHLPALIITLGTLFIGQGIANCIADGRVITFLEPVLVEFARHRIFGIIPVYAVILVVVVVTVFVLVQKTNFGICLQAVGDDARAAKHVGIRTVCVLTAVYAANALLAGTAALFETARFASADIGSFGAETSFTCIAAVILGGTPLASGRARIFGTLIGAFIMQTVITTVNMNNLPHAYALVFTSVVLVCALLAKGREQA